MERIPVILDCDPGHDDMVALILALGSARLDVKAITNVAGNKKMEKVTKNTLNILHVCGAHTVVAAGAERPLVRAYTRTDADGCHGISGLDGFEFPEDNPLKISAYKAVEVMAEVLRTSRRKVTLICTAPLTNIGILIRMFPELCKEKVERISIMGGTCHFILTKPFMEFNTYLDAEASKIVFESGIPLTMYGYDVTYRTLFKQEFIEKLYSLGNQTGTMMAKLLKEFWMMHNRVWIDLGGCPVHDACAVAGIINPSVIVKSEMMHVYIQTEPGPLSGATICDYSHRSGERENVEVVFELDNEVFFDMILNSAKALR